MRLVQNKVLYFCLTQINYPTKGYKKYKNNCFPENDHMIKHIFFYCLILLINCHFSNETSLLRLIGVVYKYQVCELIRLHSVLIY